jgi:hypothetical protein
MIVVACATVVGIILSIIGFYLKSELKEDRVAIGVGSVVIFALISFATVILIVTGRYWALVFLLPYLIIRFIMNKKQRDEKATKVTWCEFCMGTGIGTASVLIVLWLLARYIMSNKEK